jgi:GTP pyrophosphokinase
MLLFLQGSTVVDFAYSVHTQLGNEMRAALVNGRLVAPSYVLSNGEVVEVKRESVVTPSTVRRHQQWIGLVHTRSAKLKIKQFVKEHVHLGAKLQTDASSVATAKDAGPAEKDWMLEESEC